MNKFLSISVVVFVACLSAPALADNAQTDSVGDCGQAEAMLVATVKTKLTAALTGDVDKDFATLVQAHEKVGKKIYQIEAKCGKNPQLQSTASEEADAAQKRMRLIGSIPIP